jgi:hypothetical protein
MPGTFLAALSLIWRSLPLATPLETKDKWTPGDKIVISIVYSYLSSVCYIVEGSK